MEKKESGECRESLKVERKLALKIFINAKQIDLNLSASSGLWKNYVTKPWTWSIVSAREWARDCLH